MNEKHLSHSKFWPSESKSEVKRTNELSSWEERTPTPTWASGTKIKTNLSSKSWWHNVIVQPWSYILLCAEGMPSRYPELNHQPACTLWRQSSFAPNCTLNHLDALPLAPAAARWCKVKSWCRAKWKAKWCRAKCVWCRGGPPPPLGGITAKPWRATLSSRSHHHLY